MDDRHSDRPGVLILRPARAPSNCSPHQGRLGTSPAEGKRLGRPLRLDEDQMTAIHQDLAENMTVAAIGKKYGIPRTTLRDNIERAGREVQ